MDWVSLFLDYVLSPLGSDHLACKAVALMLQSIRIKIHIYTYIYHVDAHVDRPEISKRYRSHLTRFPRHRNCTRRVHGISHHISQSKAKHFELLMYFLFYSLTQHPTSQSLSLSMTTRIVLTSPHPITSLSNCTQNKPSNEFHASQKKAENAYVHVRAPSAL